MDLKNEAKGLGKFCLIVLTVVLAVRKDWGWFALSLVVTIAIYYVQEYRKMYGSKPPAQKPKKKKR
jgi:hypothetical protein